jgi:hypothetical protein
VSLLARGEAIFEKPKEFRIIHEEISYIFGCGS